MLVVRHLCPITYLYRNVDGGNERSASGPLIFCINADRYEKLCCFIEHLLWCDRFDGDCVENNPEAALDKSKPWSRSIEDLHAGSTLPSPITGNGLTRVGRHSTLRYSAHTQLSVLMIDYLCVSV